MLLQLRANWRGIGVVKNGSDRQDDGGLLFAGRIVPLRREGNVVYARSLRRGEEDTGEGVHLRAGDRLVVPVGEFVIDSRDIDEYHNPKGHGGYRPVANTVWTWHQFASEQLGFFLFLFLFLFALARRTDATHALWASAIERCETAMKTAGVAQRQAHFNALAGAEVTIIALGRCYRMVRRLVAQHCPALQVPDSVTKTSEAVLQMRNAFEHIDERSEGRVTPGKVAAEALTVFHQPEFVRSSVLRYKHYEMNFKSDVLSVLIDCRELVMDAIEERAKQ